MILKFPIYCNIAEKLLPHYISDSATFIYYISTLMNVEEVKMMNIPSSPLIIITQDLSQKHK